MWPTLLDLPSACLYAVSLSNRLETCNRGTHAKILTPPCIILHTQTAGVIIYCIVCPLQRALWTSLVLLLPAPYKSCMFVLTSGYSVVIRNTCENVLLIQWLVTEGGTWLLVSSGVSDFINTFRWGRESLAKFSSILTAEHRPDNAGERLRSKKYINRTFCGIQVSLSNNLLLYCQNKFLLQLYLRGQCSCGRTKRIAFSFVYC